MKKIKTIIFNTWTLSILSFLAIGLVIYFIGPLLSIGEWKPLSSALSRWVTILLIILFWCGLKIYRIVKIKNEENGFLGNLFTKNSADKDDITSSERKILDTKFKDSIASLKKSSKNIGKRFNLYEVPWYIIIGPPGSGKTTALLNSGLKFPLSKEFGAGAIKGIGGTRNCDWWFTDQGVIIDTAGRYTTQDSHKEADSSAWTEFLSLLKKFRKRRPINGVFLTISIQEILLQTVDQRAQHVAAISNRLQELRDAFNIDFPVYLLITKCDLIAGFDEYFDSFGKTEREQVWGITLPYESDQNKSIPLELISTEYDKLLQTINDRLIPRLHSERDHQRAQKIASFPKQLQSIKPLIERFITDIFDNSRYSRRILLRGCYFCSGTQEGTPIDRLMNKLSGPSPTSFNQGPGKSFFLKNLFDHIVFAESELVGSDIKLEKKLKVLNLAAVIGIISITTLITTGWGLSYINNRELISTTQNQLNDIEILLKNLSPTDMNPAVTLPLLDAMESLPVAYDESATFLSGLGLYQGSKIGEQILNSYYEVLNKTLLSRLMVNSENKIANRQDDKSYIYAALRTYLMLGSDEHYNSEEVATFYHYDWLNPIARSISNEEYSRLSAHINTLFERRPSPLPIPLDKDLIQQTQLLLSNTPLETTVYSRLQQVTLPDVSGFTLYDKAGRQLAEKVFIRTSGKPLTEGIDALYTKKAYSKVINTEIEKLTDEVLEDTWIYGDNYHRNREINRAALINEVKTQYRKNYIAEYRNLLNDIDIIPFANYKDATSVLQVLSGQSGSEPSPLLMLLNAVKEETQFGLAQYADSMADNPMLQKAQNKLKRILGESSDGLSHTTTQPGDPITQAFKPLHKLLEPPSEGAPIPLDALLNQIGEIYGFMAKISLDSKSGALDPAIAKAGQEHIQTTQLLAENQTDLFIKPFMNSVARRSANLTLGGVVAHINQQWAQEPYKFCINAVNNRYPFNKNSGNEITLADFGQFFGYGGMLDEFFKRHLKDYIDTTSSPWKVHSNRARLISVSAQALKAFENAHHIRRAFFDPGEKKPRVAFKLQPKQLDDGLRGFYLNLEGQSVSYEFGPLLADSLVWPGSGAGSGTSITLKQVSGEDISIYEEGDWSWFKLLDKVATVKASSPSVFKVNFKVSGYSANYTLTAGGAYSPYGLGSRMNFKCPKTL